MLPHFCQILFRKREEKIQNLISVIIAFGETMSCFYYIYIIYNRCTKLQNRHIFITINKLLFGYNNIQV